MTVRGKLFPSENQARKLTNLMRAQSSCMRYAYNRLCEGKSKSAIESDLKEKFPQINSRYRGDGYFRAKVNYESAKELAEAGNLESPEKVVFGGRRNLKHRERSKVSNREWKRLRNNQLYSRGDRSTDGNLNLRIVELDGGLCLRVNIRYLEWIHVPAYVADGREQFLSGDEPYGIRVLREDSEYELRASFEKMREPKVGFERGTVGVDFNQTSVDLAVINEQGQLKETRTIECRALTSARKGKREWLIGNLAKKIVDYAKYWARGTAIEKLSDVSRGQPNQHEFVHQKFLEAVKRRAEKEGVAIREVNPTYTSVIGRWKYAPYYRITVHQAAALVIARRGQGFSERLKGLKTLLFEPSEGGEEREGTPSRRVHSWSLWRLMRNLPERKAPEHKHSGQSPETIGVESRRTSASTERSPGGGGTLGGETAIPGSRPFAQDAVA